MTELKRCPHCGSKAVYVHSMAYDWAKCGNMNCHNTATISVRYWNTRPIEDELNARIAQLTAQLAEWKADAERLIQLSNFKNKRANEYFDLHQQLVAKYGGENNQGNVFNGIENPASDADISGWMK